MYKIKEEYMLGQSCIKEIAETSKTIRLDLSLKHNPYINTGTITGRVQDETGKPIVNATVIIFNENYEIRANTLTENDGVYLINTIDSGTEYIIYAKAPGFKLSDPGIIFIKENETTTVDFSLKNDQGERTSLIVGTVQDSENLPITTAVIELFKIEETGTRPIALTFSNEFGQFILSNLSIDSFFLKINAQGYFSEYYPVNINKINEIIPVTITLKKDLKASKGIITGVITNDEDLPLPNADVVLYRIGQNQKQIPVDYTRTNKEGVYMFVNIPSGSYRINSNRVIII
ncbi:MAG: carboxypeptidase regulatory-like domain-containing protein [Clostridiaceae bacterium]|nr:carboxypeptidase regulatory-like domain-containing protein [Clostridiaceae bacterium]